MAFPQPDKITIIKANGDIIHEIPALVLQEKIYINDSTVPIEENDKIERQIPSGLPEKYRVLNRGYYSVPNPHYQVEISKESAISSEKSESTTVFHLHGDNSRINYKSTDSSSNVVTKIDLNKFEEIKQVINNQISDDEGREKSLESLDELKKSVGSSSYVEKYKNFIDITSKYVTIIAPFIPYLTSYLPYN